MPHDIVFFLIGVFGRICGNTTSSIKFLFLDVLDYIIYKQENKVDGGVSCFPKNPVPKSPEISQIRFWEEFLGKWDLATECSTTVGFAG